MGEPGPGAANCAGIGIGRHAESAVPAEADLREEDPDSLGQGILQEDRQRRALRQLSASYAGGTLAASAQGGTAARARHQLLTWRVVVPVRRAKAAWLTSARASRAANSVPKSACIGSKHGSGFHEATLNLLSLWRISRDKRGYHG